MFRNYLITAFRTLKKRPVYTIINVVGLFMGLTGSLVIYCVLQYETNFDGFHTDSNRIYRVVQDNHTADGVQHWNTTAYTLASAMRDDFANIEVAQTAGPVQRIISTNGGSVTRRFEIENILFSDQSYLEMFDFKKAFNIESPYWLQGDRSSAFDLLNSTVITRQVAEMYFPGALENGESLLGRSLLLNNKDELIITGVVENPPANTNLIFEMLINYAFFKKHNPFYTQNWSGNYQGSTYVKLPENYDPNTLLSQFPKLQAKYMNEQDQRRIEYNVKPLSELHNDPLYGASIGSYIVSKPILIGLAFMALFLLLIGAMNYINLSTAQAAKRAKEVGIRKVIGSSKTGLMKQFFLETLLLAGIAGIHAYAVSGLILDQLNGTLSSLNFDVSLTDSAIWFLVGVVVFISILASIYPAVSISRYNPIAALKSKISGNSLKDRILRNSLVIGQFAIVQLLIIGTFVVSSQMNYFKNEDLGFDKEALVVVNVPDRNLEQLESFKQKLLQRPDLANVSYASGIPTEPTIQYGTSFRYAHESDEMNREAEMKVIDLQYLKLYDLQIIAGKWLTEYNVTHQGFNGFVVNETLVKMLNTTPEEIIGKEIQINEGKASVVGVVKDFNNHSLQEAITPCIMFHWGTGFFSEAGIKLNHSADIPETLKYIEEAWHQTFIDKVYSYEFVDDYLARSYQVEEMIFLTFQIASILAIIIGCMGLYGLIAFITESRTKEMGIRKVLGAGILGIINSLSRNLLGLLSIAVFIGSFFGWYVMAIWLESFSNKVEIGIGVFLLSAFSTIALALLTTTSKILKTATANPVDSLRYE